MLGADLGAALGYVAHPQAVLLLSGLFAILQDIQWVHIQLGDTDEETRSSKRLFVLLVVTDDVASVLTKEALDALSKFLAAFDIHLLHPELAGFQIGWRLKGRNFHGLLEVEGNIGNQISDDRESAKGCDRDGFALFKHIHASHAGKTRLAVDLHRTRSALACLAVPANCQVRHLRRLNAVNNVENNFAFICFNFYVLQCAVFGISTPNAKFDHLFDRAHFAPPSCAVISSGVMYFSSSCGSKRSKSSFGMLGNFCVTAVTFEPSHVQIELT